MQHLMVHFRTFSCGGIIYIINIFWSIIIKTPGQKNLSILSPEMGKSAIFRHKSSQVINRLKNFQFIFWLDLSISVYLNLITIVRIILSIVQFIIRKKVKEIALQCLRQHHYLAHQNKKTNILKFHGESYDNISEFGYNSLNIKSTLKIDGFIWWWELRLSSL